MFESDVLRIESSIERVEYFVEGREEDVMIVKKGEELSLMGKKERRECSECVLL